MSKAQRERISSMGGRASHGGRGRQETDYDDRDSTTSSRGARSHGRQGFASMGGRASHGGRDRDYYDENEYEEGNYDDRRYGMSGEYGQDYDEDDYRDDEDEGYYDRDENDDDQPRYAQSGRSQDYFDEENEDDNRRSGGRQGFAAMDPDRQRRIASMGGRASHGGRGRGRQSRSGRY